jgi:hypothetical protein
MRITAEIDEKKEEDEKKEDTPLHVVYAIVSYSL